MTREDLDKMTSVQAGEKWIREFEERFDYLSKDGAQMHFDDGWDLLDECYMAQFIIVKFIKERMDDYRKELR